MIKENFVAQLAQRYKEYWDLPAFSNYEEDKTYTFADLSKWVAKVHLILEANKIQRGDKVTIIGNDSAEWCMTWMGVVTYGAVIVPILPQFHKDDILHIIQHSDSRMAFVGKQHEPMLAPTDLPEVKNYYSIADLKELVALVPQKANTLPSVEELFAEKYPNGFTREEIEYPHIGNEELVLISYTSGTSGFSKGVMATANNLMANMQFGHDADLLHRGEKLLCFLPNAHAYSCAFNFLLPQFEGTHVYILSSKPTPQILLKALKEVRPVLLLSVPLILEKIYKGAVAPKLRNKWLRLALKLPLINKLIHKKFRTSLMEALGGNFSEMIIGGAALNPEVEAFLLKIGFPLTVGYGMTECSPIISYTNHRSFRKLSAGKILHKIEEVRIENPKEIEGEMIGEVQVKGENVCQGYYKNPEATAQLFTEDGWMRTGDLGYIKDDFLYLKGRSKAMLLSSDGQNIYPEELEARLAMQPFVNDAIVVQREKKIVAIVSVDRVALKKAGHHTDNDIKAIMEENRQKVNESSARYAHIGAVEILEGEFEKTPKQSIKRYLYK